MNGCYSLKKLTISKNYLYLKTSILMTIKTKKNHCIPPISVYINAYINIIIKYVNACITTSYK